MWIANMLLLRAPEGYGEMGVFNVAWQWHTALLFLPSVFTSVNVPVLSSLFGKHDVQQCRHVMVGTMKASALLILPVALLLSFGSEFFMTLFGADFAGRGQTLSITVLMSSLLSVMLPITQIITATGQMWIGALMTTGWASVLIASSYCLTSSGWGASGLALAYLIAYAVQAIAMFLFAASLLKRWATETP
jgi:O-antigen/teichoic acid export membrane protein